MRRARITAALTFAIALAYLVLVTEGPAPRADRSQAAEPTSIDRACGLESRELVRLWRGFDPRRSEDVMVVPQQPNYFGSFQITSHTGPWDYVQEIPLVLYGPGVVNSGVVSNRPVNLVDVYPTIGRLLDVDLPTRAGAALTESLPSRTGPRPALVVVIVWDGVGKNVLARWPDRWPNLRRLGQSGTIYEHATVGSSPSITPASHSSLGTGAWPRGHRVTAIRMRINGHPGRSFRGGDPSVLARSTFADVVDRSYDNRPLVALVGWQTWHLGMLGHGASYPGGDKDIAAIIHKTGRIDGNTHFYSTPDYLAALAPNLERHEQETDRADGAADGRWLGHDVAAKETPAWIEYESDVIRRLLQRGRFGRDSIPDLLMVNFKITDIVGHLYTLDSEEMAEVLAAQDEAFDKIVDYLHSLHRRFVVVVSADHGHTPAPGNSGAWPISQSELVDDLNEEFGVPPDESLVAKSHAAGFFLNRSVARRLDVDAGAVARWLNNYRLADNVTGEVPADYRGRMDERLFSAAFASSDLDDVIRCAFGAAHPPKSFDA